MAGAAVSILTETGPTPTLAKSKVENGCDGKDGQPITEAIESKPTEVDFRP